MKKLNIKGAAMKIAATGGGAVAAASLDKVSAISSMNTAVKGILKIGLGAFVPQFLGKGKKAQMLEDAGAGAIAVGVLQLANATAFKTNPLAIAGVTDTLGGIGAPVYVDENYTVSGTDTLGAVTDMQSPEYSY